VIQLSHLRGTPETESVTETNLEPEFIRQDPILKFVVAHTMYCYSQ